MQSKFEDVQDTFQSLPRDFYGIVEVHFVKGQPIYVKTITTKKINPHAKAQGEDHEFQFQR